MLLCCVGADSAGRAGGGGAGAGSGAGGPCSVPQNGSPPCASCVRRGSQGADGLSRLPAPVGTRVRLHAALLPRATLISVNLLCKKPLSCETFPAKGEVSGCSKPRRAQRGAAKEHRGTRRWLWGSFTGSSCFPSVPGSE